MAESEAKPAATIPEVPSNIRPTQIVALLLSLAALRYAAEFVVPIRVAVLAAIALAPPVRVLSRALPRWFAAAIVVLAGTRAIRPRCARDRRACSSRPKVECVGGS